jgi:hypothetical protein
VRSGESNEGEVAAQNRSGRLDHATFIPEQQEIGRTLLEIADMIAAHWETLDKLPRKHETPTPGASGEVGNVDREPRARGPPVQLDRLGAGEVQRIHGDPVHVRDRLRQLRRPLADEGETRGGGGRHVADSTRSPGDILPRR